MTAELEMTIRRHLGTENNLWYSLIAYIQGTGTWEHFIHEAEKFIDGEPKGCTCEVCRLLRKEI